MEETGDETPPKTYEGASTASTTLQNVNGDLDELKFKEGIAVWGANQELLEEQALNELNLFSKETAAPEALEEGEIVEDSVPDSSNSKSFDFHTYFSTQEAYKKRQDYAKSLVPKTSFRPKKFGKKRRKVSSEDGADKAELVESNAALRLKEASEKVERNCTSEASGSEYMPSDDELGSDYEPGYDPSDNRQTGDACDRTVASQKRKRTPKTEGIDRLKDDGMYQYYKSRLKAHYRNVEEELALKDINANDEAAEEEADHHLVKGGLKVPLNVWNKLYGYQQTGLKWLWKIHREATGGILGDEMGLGKTVQIIAFLQSLENSRVMSCHGRFNGLGPTLIACPATVVHQWVRHFHDWAPEFRVAVLHQSGSFQGDKADLIREIHKDKGIIVTTYLGMLKYKGDLLEYNWHYLILDEGHKIRNPTAKVTVAVKQFRTPHRLLLTGSPMQNNLSELWSLFDFTNPGMLGNLQTFQEHFAAPILHGGFANSTPMQEATALSVATTLKDLITPYLLRRAKHEVQHHISLPNKSEQVLFCSMTPDQRDLYKRFLMSERVGMILGRGGKNWFADNYVRANMLVAITTLRKITNHPDIYLSTADGDQDAEPQQGEDSYGYYKKSGKMIVVSALLKIWKKQGHRVLLFTQSRPMMGIFQNFLQRHGYSYLKMDGSTSVGSRQPLIEKFNKDPTYEVFLLTTRVGGLGINLTGANRVIIYDPDWNPATDTQARERAWRIGQDKQVTIYRLLAAGTIEEKIYQRQVWKQLLSNKVLLDPKTSRFFKSSDLHDLFSLQESTDANPETANIFHDSRVRIQENVQKKHNRKRKPSTCSTNIEFTKDKIDSMKAMAQRIAKSMSRSPEAKKTSLQLELEEEKELKRKEKAELRKLTPGSLLLYNKEKSNGREEFGNRIDDSEAKVGFSEALEYAERAAQLHHTLIENAADPRTLSEEVREIREKVTRRSAEDPLGKYEKRAEKERKSRTKVDTSGTVDGERVDGLVKAEIKKYKNKGKVHSRDEAQDDFVLGKLFQKKGVSGALQHDTVVQSGSQGGSLRIHTEAKQRAEKSLEALRKSRLTGWRW